MRKLFLVSLVTLMMFMPVIALSETYTSGALGATFPVPVDFTARDLEDGVKGIHGVQVVANDGSVLYLVVFIEDEAFVGVSMENITEEKMKAIGYILFENEAFECEPYVDDDGDFFIEFFAADGSKLVIAYVFDDGFIEIDALVSPGEELTDDQIDAFFEFLDTVEYDEE